MIFTMNISNYWHVDPTVEHHLSPTAGTTDPDSSPVILGYQYIQK